MLRYRIAIVRAAVVVAAVLCLAGRADAASCTIRTTSVAFGSYNVFSTGPNDSTGTVVYRCNGNATDSIWISMTPGSSNTFNSREMRRGVDVLQYNLYRDASRTVIWGNLSGGTSVYYDYGLANNRDTTVTVYGRIPAGQDVSAGAYSDTVTIEIWF